MSACLLEPEIEAVEVAEVVTDVAAFLKMRMRRQDTPGARVVAIGKVLHVLEGMLPPPAAAAGSEPSQVAKGPRKEAA